MDLEDLRKCNWIPRGGEKGPKTIEEVREEVEKEERMNEIERMEHEKKQEKLMPSRKTSRQGYIGRSSQDRRAAAGVGFLEILLKSLIHINFRLQARASESQKLKVA